MQLQQKPTLGFNPSHCNHRPDNPNHTCIIFMLNLNLVYIVHTVYTYMDIFLDVSVYLSKPSFKWGFLKHTCQNCVFYPHATFIILKKMWLTISTYMYNNQGLGTPNLYHSQPTTAYRTNTPEETKARESLDYFHSKSHTQVIEQQIITRDYLSI